ncbi:MAG: hypothetical protein Q9164_004942 [Protoblastenia rupestris]
MASNSAFKDVKDGITAALVETTRTVGQISNEDLAFHRSSNPAVAPLLEQQSSRVLNLAKGLIRVATSDTEIAAPKFSDIDSVDDNWRGIVDVFDILLEKADACLDEYTGVIKRLSPSQEEQIANAAPRPAKQRPDKAYRTQNIAKPQLHFNHTPQNYEKTPFKPLLTFKPHALISLTESLQLVPSEDSSSQEYDAHTSSLTKDTHQHIRKSTNSPLRYKHPYENEIKEAQTIPSVHVKSDPIPYLPLESTAATFVDSPEGVQGMLEELKQAKDIAIDLEHHDDHSYIGLVSLMQISTREKDWVVDTLRPWRQDLQILNEVFTDPKILKVFHGSTMDMIWLQRDLGLYVVGLFDTYHAASALGYPKRSLAFLLKKFVEFDAAKQYQMADWRIRPLPTEMFNYARSDTHFLLFVYDMMRNELIERSDFSIPNGDLIEYVIENSKNESLQKYERPFYDEQRGSGPLGWYGMLYRTPALFNREQFAVFRAVHRWRDEVAREEDEGLNTVMPKRVLYTIARETPTDMISLLGCSHPMSKPYQKRKKDLLQIVKEAKAAGATGPEMKDFMPALQSNSFQLSTDSKPVNGEIVTYNRALASAAAGSSSDDTLRVRLDTSAFWGPSIATAQQASDYRLHDAINNLRLALPLPELTAEVFVETKAQNHGNIMSQSTAGARAEHQYLKERKPRENDVFIVREFDGPKKRTAVDAQLVPDPKSKGDMGNGSNYREMEEMALGEEVLEAESLRAERKREKYERKLERKRLRHEKASQAENAGKEAEPFDYENAPSVLRANKAYVVKSSTSKSANPYAKSLDAPKGMRKSQKEVAGRSLTYKN